ncbi:ninjurin-2-like isoform X2 [Pomacea canaliculata]|uniref:ninjurin-2-like isoform X2 n=1 Tax=Pomacea canaliculata TaxID=400727 RepID=UPI000D734A65|nr:ninjurin-2-like isoform X2 [Pomacea canaliculata]
MAGFGERITESPFEGPKQFQPTRSYATRKTVAEGLLDIALLLANASQLKAMVTLPSDKRDHFFVAQIVLIGLSILLQIVTGVILFTLGMMNPKDEEGHQRAINLNNASVGLILFITIINVFISSFGFNYSV